MGGKTLLVGRVFKHYKSTPFTMNLLTKIAPFLHNLLTFARNTRHRYL